MARKIAVKKASGDAAGKSVASPVAEAKARRPVELKAEQVVATTLPVAMTGRASPAKAKDGDEPVFAYIRSLPQPQRGIAECVDALAARTLPALQSSVKWGMALVGRRRRLVFQLWRLRRPRQTHVRPRHCAQSDPISYADRDGQGLARRKPRIRGRPQRTPGRVVDETSHGDSRLRGKEAMSPVEAGVMRMNRTGYSGDHFG